MEGGLEVFGVPCLFGGWRELGRLDIPGVSPEFETPRKRSNYLNGLDILWASGALHVLDALHESGAL